MANPEPLKLKDIEDIILNEQLGDLTFHAMMDKISERIRSACEWFLSKIDDLYHQLEKGVVWGLNNDELCDMIEDYVKEKFKLAFKDVLDGGDKDGK